MAIMGAIRPLGRFERQLMRLSRRSLETARISSTSPASGCSQRRLGHRTAPRLGSTGCRSGPETRTSKFEVRKRIGSLTDDADAVILACHSARKVWCAGHRNESAAAARVGLRAGWVHKPVKMVRLRLALDSADGSTAFVVSRAWRLSRSRADRARASAHGWG